jgi:hypothetical protein
MKIKGVEDGMSDEQALVCECGQQLRHAGWLSCLELGLKVRGVHPSAVPVAKPEPPATESAKCPDCGGVLPTHWAICSKLAAPVKSPTTPSAPKVVDSKEEQTG